MNNRIDLFVTAAKRFALGQKVSVRKLYTDHIYPYPFEYFNTKLYPTMLKYRETWPIPKTHAYDVKRTWLCWRFFWASWWYQLFNNPGVVLGHTHLPDPSQWTDAQLGIPPDEEGSYLEWLEQHGAKE